MVSALLLFLSKPGEGRRGEAHISLTEQAQPCAPLSLLLGSSPNLNFPTPLTQLVPFFFFPKLRGERVVAQLLGSCVLFPPPTLVEADKRPRPDPLSCRTARPALSGRAWRSPRSAGGSAGAWRPLSSQEQRGERPS